MTERMRFGAIDIGSNSIRLLVAEFPERGGGRSGVRTISRAGEPCRLGRGLGETGLVDSGVAEKAADLVAEFAERARMLGAVHIVAAATAALRSANNGPDIARTLGLRAGLPVRILTGEEEARLVYRSVVKGLGRAASRSSCIVFDLGGGSTEVVSGLGAEPGRWTSLPFGAVSLTERFLSTNPCDPVEIAALEAHIDQTLMHECAYMPREAPVLAGVGGTVTVLAMLDRKLKTYEPGRLEGWGITLERLRELAERIVTTSQAERRRWPAMGEGRADIVVAGVVVVRSLLRRFPSPSLLCSTQGLRYALARLAAEEYGASATGG